MNPMEIIYNKAHEAGLKAGTDAMCVPMVVGTPISMFGNTINQSKPVYEVPDGVCGFANVIVKPANSKFANWVKKQTYIRSGKGYYGGLRMPVLGFGQSLTRKESYAYAFSSVLSENNIRSYVDSRMD